MVGSGTLVMAVWWVIVVMLGYYSGVAVALHVLGSTNRNSQILIFYIMSVPAPFRCCGSGTKMTFSNVFVV